MIIPIEYHRENKYHKSLRAFFKHTPGSYVHKKRAVL